MPKENKVVLDTNIWITYFIKGKEPELLELIFNNDLEVFTSNELQNELQEVLSRSKFKKYLNAPIENYIAFHRKVATKISPSKVIDFIPDPKDNFLFDLAIAADAGYVITGDKILLALKKVYKVQVISLSAFKKVKGAGEM